MNWLKPYLSYLMYACLINLRQSADPTLLSFLFLTNRDFEKVLIVENASSVILVLIILSKLPSDMTRLLEHLKCSLIALKTALCNLLLSLLVNTISL